MKGLTVQILRPAHGNASNGGISSYCTKATLVGMGIPEIDEPTAVAPAIKIVMRYGIGGKMPQLPPGQTGHVPNPYFHVEPIDRPLPDMVGWMFGGCAVYTSDSRFPLDYPIKLHDRAELQEKSV